MTLFSTKYPNTSRTVSGTYSVDDEDVILLCDTSQAPVIINLQEIPEGYWNTLYKLYVIDNSNNAGTNSITINAPNGYKINTDSSFVIAKNGGGAIVRITSNLTYGSTNINGHTIKDSTTTFAQKPNLKFTGNVTVSNSGNDTIVDVTGGGATSLTIANTVFVAKNGSDSTGLVQRLDKPFLTIAAARLAAVAFFNPSATNRILIKVFSGNYIEQILLVDYIDYDLTDCVISQSTQGTLITDNNVAVNSIVYGQANLITNVSGAGDSYSVNILNANSFVVIRLNNITMNGTEGNLFGVYSIGKLYFYCNDISCENSGAGFVAGLQAVSGGIVYAYVNNITTKEVGGVSFCINSAGTNAKLYIIANNLSSEGGDSANGVWTVSIQSNGYMDLKCKNIYCTPTSISSSRGWAVGTGAGGGIGIINCDYIICSPTINEYATCINFGAAGSEVLSPTSSLYVCCVEATINAIATTNNVIRQEDADASSRFYFKGRAVVSSSLDTPVINKNTGIMILDDVTLVGGSSTTNSITCPGANNVYVYGGRSNKAVDVNTTQLVSNLLIDTNVI